MSDQLDSELRRLRSTLHATAGRDAHSEQVLAEIRGSVNPPIATLGAESSRSGGSGPRRWLAIAAAVVLVGSGLYGATRLLQQRDTAEFEVEPQTSLPLATASLSPPSTIGEPSTTSTTVSSVAVLPTGRLIEAHFFDPGHGWVLAQDQSDGPVSLWTSEDGANWTLKTLPGADVYSVTMADTTNGWALGSDVWWSTHDGGATWQNLTHNGVSPNVINVVGKWAYALVFAGNNSNSATQFTLQRSTIDADEFTDTGLIFLKGPGGNDVTASIAAQGDRTFISFNDRGGQVGRLISGSVDDNWTSPGVGRGGNIYFTAAAAGGPLYTYSETGIWAGDSEVQLVAEASSDGGDTFAPVPMPAAAVADGGRSLAQMTAVDASTVVAQISRNNTLDLYISHDVGATWELLPATPPGLGRIDISFGIMWGLLSTDTIDQLWASTNDGQSWHMIIG